MTLKEKEEIRKEIIEYSKLSDEDKLNWLYECLLFYNYGFSDEDKKKREKIKQILESGTIKIPAGG